MGANVTAPHKQAVVAFWTTCPTKSVALGVVNTIVNQTGRLTAATPTRAGWRAGCGRLASTPAGRPALVLGAGGAARATVWALADLEASSDAGAESHRRTGPGMW